MRLLNSLPIPATWLAIIAFVAPAGAQFDVDPSEILDGRTIDFPIPREAVQAKALFDQGNDRIDPALRTLVAQAAGQGGGAFAAQAKSLGVPLGDATRTVSVALSPDEGSSVDALLAVARDHDAEVTAVLADVVFASVPLDQLEALGAAGELHYIAPQAQYSPSYPALAAAGSIATDGVQSVGADKLHAAGITGRGVKVGILDFGFQGYSALQRAGQLPAPKAAKAFNNSGRVEAESVHGTACAEIVHAMAPDADLYLAAVTGPVAQIIQAAKWLADQGVDIVSFSGGTQAGPHNGNDILDKLVAEIYGRGILWVNAAGNEGDLHWGGPATDRNGDGFIEMGRNGENFIVVQAAGNGLYLMVTWDDWGPNPARPSATQDLNAYLYPFDPRTGTYALPPIAVSVNPQQGLGRPIELLQAQVPRGSTYMLVLRALNVSRPVQVHVYSYPFTPSTPPARLSPTVPDGSIGIPATSEVALAVGAVDVRSLDLEDFSSNGPTDDGRIKPDVSAPDMTRSAAYEGRFPGTSAACPHVSGFAALVKQRYGASHRALTAYVKRATRAMGSGERNNQYGFGYIDASKLDSIVFSLGEVELPEDWGGAIEFKELDAQLAAARSGRDLGLKVVVGRDEYRIGDGLKVGITAERGCYYLLLGRDEQGNFAVISPLGDDRPRLRAGEKRAFPERGTIRVTGPPGRDEVILIGSREPLDARSWRSSDSVSVARVSYRVVR